MKVDFPGLCVETMPSGSVRYRVRVEGKPSRKIALSVEPDHPKFQEHYRAARAGVKLDPEAESTALKGSFGELIEKHIAELELSVEQGKLSPATLRQRISILTRLNTEYGNRPRQMPRENLQEILGAMPYGAAKNALTTVKMMYQGEPENPAIGIPRPKPNKPKSEIGATPWTPQALRAYRETHKPGTMAHLTLTLFMFTACRISDATVLGRGNEFERNGETWIGWQPSKRGSAYVEIPLLPPLLKATRAQKIVGPTYILTEYGTPHRSPEGLRNRFKKWCTQAGLENMSSHGIRKAVGKLLAEEGCSQYQIMAVHGHTDSKTSSVYTQGAERSRLAGEAAKILEAMEW